MFRILWADAAGIIESEPCSLVNNFDTIQRYVYSLYCPPDGHCLKDETMQLAKSSLSGPAVWSLTADWGTYNNCSTIFTGAPVGRRTVVYRYEEGGKLAIIKDVYVSEDYVEKRGERGLFHILQKAGFIPGLMRYFQSGHVHPRYGMEIVTASAGADGKKLKKYRLVYLSTGTSLFGATTAKDILMAMYDVVEGASSID